MTRLKTLAREQGLWNLFLPHSHRAPQGLSNFDYAPLCEIMGRVHWASEVFNCSAPDTGNMETLERYASESLKDRWLEPLLRGEIRSAFLMTEPAVASSDATNIQCEIRRDGDEYVINGSKTFISNGYLADLMVVVVKTDPAAGSKGVSLLVVETDREGFRRGRKLEKVGLRAQDTAELFFDNVRVPVTNLLGEEGKGFAYLMEELPQERFVIAVAAAAKLERLLSLTLDYVKERKAFGQTVWDFQNTKFKLADVKAQAVGLRTMVDYYLAQHMSRKLTLEESAIAKLHATEILWKCLDDMVQMHGGYGYMLEYPIARAFIDMRVNRIYGGSNEVMRELIARKL